MKPTIQILTDGGHKISWKRHDGVTYSEINKRSRSKREAWVQARRFFLLVGCQEVPEEFANNEKTD